VLEVITENVKAIKLYDGIGFEIGKNDMCYAGIISVETQEEFTLREIAFNTVKWDEIPNQTLQS
jgi:hypothetical protein